MVSYAMLGGEPDVVHAPQTAAEVAEIVRAARADGKAVIPWGGGTGQDYGYLPRRSNIVLHLAGLNRILAHEPGDLTVTVEAGATLPEIQAALALHGQFLPIDPPHAGSGATIGGMLATNAGGISRLGYGSLRDYLIGITVVDSGGRLIRGGGKVVKNVTGYDLPKLHIGALGTLGIIVEATFKIAPRPEATQTLRFAAPDTESENRFFAELHTETQPVFSLLTSTPSRRSILLRFAGQREVVESECDRARQIATGCGLGEFTAVSDEQPAEPIHLPDSALQVRVTGRASDSLNRHTAIAAMTRWQQVDTSPALGQIDAAADPGADPLALTAVLNEWAQRTGNAVTILHAPNLLRGGKHDLWYPLPSAFGLMRRLKETLDADAILNPGRFVGRL